MWLLVIVPIDWSTQSNYLEFLQQFNMYNDFEQTWSRFHSSQLWTAICYRNAFQLQ